MNNPGSVEQDANASLVNHGIVRWAIKQAIFVLILAAVLFMSADRYVGARAWIYLSTGVHPFDTADPWLRMGSYLGSRDHGHYDSAHFT